MKKVSKRASKKKTKKKVVAKKSALVTRIFKKEDVDFDEIVKQLKNTKDFNLICMPLLYTPAQLVTTRLIEFFQEGARVVWSVTDSGLRRVQIYYSDTKEQGSHLQGTMPEENWDEIAFHFFQRELNQLLVDLSPHRIKPKSEKALLELLKKANSIWEGRLKIDLTI